MERKSYIDLLNIISCLFVVILHANWYVQFYDKTDCWWLRVLFEVLCYGAVPIFFMISGATLLGFKNKYSTKIFYKKRILKTFIPYLFWGNLFFWFHYFYKSSQHGINQSFTETFWSYVHSLTTGFIPYTNYWFFIPLFLLYLFMPYLSELTRLSNKALISLWVGLFFFQSFLPTIDNICKLDISIIGGLPVGGFFCYMLLGYILSNNDIENNNLIFFIVSVLALLSLIIRYLGIFIPESRNDSFFSYFGLYVIFPCIWLFIAAKKLMKNPLKWYSKLQTLATYSFGIYLLHTFFRDILFNTIISRSDSFVVFKAAPIMLLGSMISIYLVRKLTIGKYLLP